MGFGRQRPARWAIIRPIFPLESQMNDVLSSAQMITFFWDSFKGLGSVLVFILAYVLKEWRATQKEYVKKVDQMVIDMRSLKDATHATNEALESMIAAVESSFKRVEVNHSKALDRMERNQTASNNQLVESMRLIAQNESLKIQNTS